MAWLHLPSITATQGSITVTVSNAFETEHIQVGDGLLIGQFALVEIVGVHSQQLTLKSAWPNATQTNVAGSIVPTASDFQLAAHLLREAMTITHGNFAQMEKWWTEDIVVAFKGYDGVIHNVPSAKKLTDKVDEVLNPLNALIADIGNLQTVAQSAVDAQHASEGARDVAIQEASAASQSKNAASTSEGNSAANAHSSEQYKNEALAARDAAISAKDVAEAMASPFVNGGAFTPSLAQEYPTLPTHGIVIVYVIEHVSPGTPYQFTTGGLQGKHIDDDDYMIAFRFAANDIRWSIMQLGSGAIMEVNNKSGSRITLNKDDIGLGHVNNWEATSAVDDPSTTKYAVAKAVFDAYRHAEDASSVANSKWTARDASITTKGIVQLSNDRDGTSEDKGVTEKALKSVNDDVVTLNNKGGFRERIIDITGWGYADAASAAFYRVGDTVCCYIYLNKVTQAVATRTKIADIPVGFRPRYYSEHPTTILNGAGSNVISRIGVGHAQDSNPNQIFCIDFSQAIPSGVYYRANCTWLTTDVFPSS